MHTNTTKVNMLNRSQKNSIPMMKYMTDEKHIAMKMSNGISLVSKLIRRSQSREWRVGRRGKEVGDIYLKLYIK